MSYLVVTYSLALRDRRSLLYTAVVTEAFPAAESGLVDAVVHVELVEEDSIVVSASSSHG